VGFRRITTTWPVLECLFNDAGSLINIGVKCTADFLYWHDNGLIILAVGTIGHDMGRGIGGTHVDVILQLRQTSPSQRAMPD